MRVLDLDEAVHQRPTASCPLFALLALAAVDMGAEVLAVLVGLLAGDPNQHRPGGELVVGNRADLHVGVEQVAEQFEEAAPSFAAIASGTAARMEQPQLGFAPLRSGGFGGLDASLEIPPALTLEAALAAFGELPNAEPPSLVGRAVVADFFDLVLRAAVAPVVRLDTDADDGQSPRWGVAVWCRH